jgi:8-oxo-dGTP pyrophosphatase MutT (NUDIX family)
MNIHQIQAFRDELEKQAAYSLREGLKRLHGSLKEASTPEELVRVQVHKPGGKRLMHWYLKAERWNYPGGRTEKGETRQEGAARELLERTGYSVKDLKSLKYKGVNQQGVHTYQTGHKNLRRVASPGAHGGYASKVTWTKPD